MNASGNIRKIEIRIIAMFLKSVEGIRVSFEDVRRREGRDVVGGLRSMF